MRLYLVRHAAVTLAPEHPSEQWRLSTDGRTAVDVLAGESCWAALARLYCSTEPKAIATAQRIAAKNALPIAIEPALREVHRPWIEGDYKTAARRYLRGEQLDGWEPRDTASRRVRACIDTIVARRGDADIGVVSHGLALTLYISGLLPLDGEASVRLWDGIAFPDYAVVDLASRQLQRPFGGS